MPDDHDQDEFPTAEVYRVAPGSTLRSSDDEDEFSLVRFVNLVLRHRRKILGVPVVLAVLVVGITVLMPDRYTSEAAFVPQTGGGMSGQLAQLSGVAAQFGINVPQGEAGQSPQFYADLLVSRRLLEEAVMTRYTRRADRGAGGGRATSDSRISTVSPRDSVVTEADTAGSTLVELYDIEESTWSRSVAEAAERLEDALSVSTDPETGVVNLSVTTPWPAVSKQVADRLIELLNRFNNRVRQSQASAEAAFVGERLAEARRELRTAEDSLERFLQRNVSWQQSPELRFEHDRLQSRVSLKQQVFTSLATRYEEARISEVKSTPVVTSVTNPQVPVRPDSGFVLLKAALALLFGGMIGLLWAFGSEFASNLREENAEDYRRFLSLKQEAVRDVRRAGAGIRRLLGSGPPEDRN